MIIRIEHLYMTEEEFKRCWDYEQMRNDFARQQAKDQNFEERFVQEHEDKYYGGTG